MHRRLILCSLILATVPAVVAQSSKDTVSTVLREILPRQEKNLIAAAEEMPADKYGFKPTPAQMSFGKLVMHITESNNELCAKAADIAEPPAVALKETDPKDKLVAALKNSFAFCDGALAKTTDAKLADQIELFGGHTGPRVFTYFALTSDWADHYSAAAMYLRLNGLLPPTAKK
ncbi:MAG: DinB family protein [Acidobacteriales bacterium]|nr:DinB family protein [Terriglobales bacterium]